MRRVDAHLRDPADAERREGFGKIARVAQVGREVIVDEEEQPFFGFERRELLDDCVDRPMARGALEKRLHRTEVAWKAAAPAGLHEANRKIAASAKDRSI